MSQAFISVYVHSSEDAGTLVANALEGPVEFHHGLQGRLGPANLPVDRDPTSAMGLFSVILVKRILHAK